MACYISVVPPIVMQKLETGFLQKYPSLGAPAQVLMVGFL